MKGDGMKRPCILMKVVSDNKIIYFNVLTNKNEEQEEVKLYVLLSISIVMTRFS